MKTRDICPYCDKVTELKKIEGNEDIEIRGEYITVPTTYFRCKQCKQDFDDPQSENDPLDAAYREYRRRYGMLQPEDIRKLRKEFDLTQKELCDLLSWGEVTISRYEKGKLQDSAHDTMLHLIKNPINMLELINKKKNVFSEEKRESLVKKLTEMIQHETDFELVYQTIFGSYKPDIYSGSQKLDIHKVNTMIRYFCYPEAQYQTKLAKLFFYADFYHFKKHHASITGLQYQKMPFGPVPKNFLRYKNYLIENKFLEMNEVSFKDNICELLKSQIGPNLDCFFSKDEIKTLEFIKKYFHNFTSKKISDLSHEEKGYSNTLDMNLISYEYAKYIKLG